MEKLKIVIVASDIDLRLAIKQKLDEEKVAVTGYLSFDSSAFLKITAQNPDIVIIGTQGDDKGVFELCERIYIGLPWVGIIVLNTEVSVLAMQRAMKCGVRNMFEMNVEPTELMNAISETVAFERQRITDSSKQRAESSKVICFFSGKGGTGKTTIAVNTAVSLAKRSYKVVLIDLDLQFGDVNLFLDVQPKDTIAELVQDRSEITIDVIKSYLTVHISGATILSAPKSPEYAEYVTPAHVETIINVIRQYYDYVIVDLAPIFSDITIAAMENSDYIGMVSCFDMATLASAKLCVNILDTLRQKEKVMLIMNKATDSIITAKDYERFIGLSPVATICEDSKTALRCLNKGTPFVTEASRSQIAKDIQNLCTVIKNNT